MTSNYDALSSPGIVVNVCSRVCLVCLVVGWTGDGDRDIDWEKLDSSWSLLVTDTLTGVRLVTLVLAS